VTPYYEADGITVWHSDFREVVQPEGAVTITDPPYGETSLAWDHWLEDWPSLIAGNEMWCFGSMRMFLEHAREFTSFAKFAPWKFGQDVVWEKHNGSGFHADRFKRVHEHAVHWYRGAWDDLLRATPTTADATARAVRRKGRPPHTGEIANSSYLSFDGGPRLMRSVITVASCHGYAVNETQKPLGIVVPLIEYSCRPGSVVFDPFMGSGSTLVAARARGLRAIGCDVREAQCEAAANRLNQRALAL
jgi:site-specific DNA-methyltransferase (adenine-specific)